MKFICKSLKISFGIITIIFTFMSGTFFECIQWITPQTLEKHNYLSRFNITDINSFFSRILCFMIVLCITMLFYKLFLHCRTRIKIKGENYIISVEYGDILKKENCKKVINFDECFTTEVGTSTASINATSICGQYLSLHKDIDIEELIELNEIKPDCDKSKYRNKTKYPSGTIIPYEDDLLMAFAKLDEKGKGRFFNRDEYIQCLDLLWKELENYYSEKDVCVPILGAGTTSFDGGYGSSISQQDLLDMMIWSYKLSSHKIKSPNKLRIICKRNPDFSINDIDV